MRMCQQIFNMRQKISVLLLLLLCALQVGAQEKERKFNPEQFQRDLEQYIVSEAALTPQESNIFFPLYREMMRKQRVFFEQLKFYWHMDASNDKACRDAIQKRDNLEVEMKQLQRDYHQRFMDLLPAGKVFRIIKAEEKFHRQAFRRMAKNKHSH